MDDLLLDRLDSYAETGVFPVDLAIKRPVVDLKGVHPLFLSKIVEPKNKPFALEAEFLRYLYTSGNKFYVDVKSQVEPKECHWFTGRQIGGAVPGEPYGPLKMENVDVMLITTREHPVYSYSGYSTGVLDTSPIPFGIRDKLRQQLCIAGFSQEEVASWYMTSMIKFANPGLDDNIPASWINGCYPWLLQEIYSIQPKYIICSGVKILKKLFGNSAQLKNYTGQLVDKEFTFLDGTTVKSKVLSIPAFGNTYDPNIIPTWDRQFKLLYNNIHQVEVKSIPTRHVAVKNASGLRSEIARVKRLAKDDPKRRIIAVDLEWEGEYPEQEGAHVLTVQFSSYPGEATVVSLHEQGKPVFEEGIPEAVKLLETILVEDGDWKPRLGGHFLRADMPWLLSLGISPIGLKHAYQPAATPEECRDEGGWDTGLMYHAYREDEEIKDGYGLKMLSLKECNVPRYDLDLINELNAYSNRKKERDELNKKLKEYQDEIATIKRETLRRRTVTAYKSDEIINLEIKINEVKKSLKECRDKRKPKGFGCISTPVLKKYAAWDADATRRLAEVCLYGDGTRKALLDDDGYGNSCWEAFWRSHRASWGFGEMERTGFLLDIKRLTELSTVCTEAYSRLLDSFKEDIRWEDFNPNSTDHRRSVLFGREMAKKKDGSYVMPEGAISFNLTPLRATDKTAWNKIIDEDRENYSASTDSLSLSILANDYPEVRKFFDICKLGRLLAGNIRPHKDVMGLDGYSHPTWDKGIYTYMREDGSVHTNLSQTKKTGRASSYDPPMQNIGKSAEAVVQSILGYKDEVPSSYPELFPEPLYKYPCRTILRARPGNVLIESDFTGAELAVMAWASGDPNMIEHVRRNALSEDDPDFYDIHSHIAVKAFHLNCEPTKAGLASIHAKRLRVAAKAVVFGIPYGRSVNSILLQCQAEGVWLSREEGEALLNSYFSLYPKTKIFLEACKDSVKHNRFVRTLFNRYRRFGYLRDENELAQAQREACNAPIQGTVADSINNAIFNLMEYKEQHPELPFTLNMQIHDALVLETSASNVKSLKQVIRKCMVEDNPIVVDGVSHYYGLDSECYIHWGEELNEDICLSEFGLHLEQVV